MKKNILLILTIGLLSHSLTAQSSTGLREGEVKAEFHFFNVTDPEGFVSAIETFDASSCAKKWREESGANVALYSRFGSRQTHIILVTYDSYDQMQLGQGIFSSCNESSVMSVAFDKTTNSGDYYNYLTELALEAGDWRENTVFSNVEIKVDGISEATYLDAWIELTDANSDSVGSYGINRVLFGNKYVSHMIFSGSNSLDDLVSGLKQTYSSDAYTSFSRKVGKIRKTVNTTLAQLIKAYPAQR